VIGGSLKAIMFAFNNSLPVFFSEGQRPFRFDYFEPGTDFTFLKLEGSEKTLKTFKGDKIVGAPKELLWERLIFILSYFGKVPLANLCKTMRYDGETITFIDEYSKLAEVRFNYCYYFGDKNCQYLAEKLVDTGYHTCYDWIAFNRGGKHDIDLIETNNRFVKKIWFYPSDRIDGNSPVKDACSVSYLTRPQLLEFDYSETMARFKIVFEMEDRGMKGKFNGYGPNGKPKHYKFRTTHLARELKKKEINVSDASNIKIADYTEKALLNDLRSSHTAYNKLLKTL
jgi:hypothetical protein